MNSDQKSFSPKLYKRDRASQPALPQKYQCLKELEKRKGCKPSPGTIYPVLKDLNKKGLIVEVDDNGKTKKYKLTDKGKKEMDIATKKFISLFYDLKEDFERYFK